MAGQMDFDRLQHKVPVDSLQFNSKLSALKEPFCGWLHTSFLSLQQDCECILRGWREARLLRAFGAEQASLFAEAKALNQRGLLFGPLNLNSTKSTLGGQCAHVLVADQGDIGDAEGEPKVEAPQWEDLHAEELESEGQPGAEIPGPQDVDDSLGYKLRADLIR